MDIVAHKLARLVQTVRMLVYRPAHPTLPENRLRVVIQKVHSNNVVDDHPLFEGFMTEQEYRQFELDSEANGWCLLDAGQGWFRNPQADLEADCA